MRAHMCAMCTWTLAPEHAECRPVPQLCVCTCEQLPCFALHSSVSSPHCASEHAMQEDNVQAMKELHEPLHSRILCSAEWCFEQICS